MSFEKGGVSGTNSNDPDKLVSSEHSLKYVKVVTISDDDKIGKTSYAISVLKLLR